MAIQVMIPSLTTYDKVRDIDYILTESESGQFLNSAMLVDQVLRNSRIFSTLMTRIVGLLGKARDIDPADPTDGRTKSTAQKVADDVAECWPYMFPHDQLVELLVWGLMHNSGLARINQDDDAWKIEVWHPWALRWDPAEATYFVQTRERVELRLDPDAGGGFRSSDGTRWVLFTPWGYGNMRRALIRPVAHLYLEIEWAHRDRARYSEVHGQPMRVGIAPETASDKECDEYEERLSPVGAEPVVVVRQGAEGRKWDAKLVEAMGKSGDLFENEIEQLHKEIAVLFLGQSQTTDGQAGLGANELAGEPVRLDVMKADSEALTGCLGSQFLEPYCEFTYGKAEYAPCISFHVDPPEDRAKKATEFKTVVEGLAGSKVGAIGVLPVNVREVLEAFSIPLMTEAEEAVMKAEADAKAQQEAAAAMKTVQSPTNGAQPKPQPTT